MEWKLVSILSLLLIITPTFALTSNQINVLNNISTTSGTTPSTLTSIFYDYDNNLTTYQTNTQIQIQTNWNNTLSTSQDLYNRTNSLNYTIQDYRNRSITDWSWMLTEVTTLKNDMTNYKSNITSKINNISTDAIMTPVNRTLEIMKQQMMDENSARFNTLETFKLDKSNFTISMAQFNSDRINSDLYLQEQINQTRILAIILFFIGMAVPILVMKAMRKKGWKEERSLITDELLGRLKKEDIVPMRTANMTLHQGLREKNRQLRNLHTIILCKSKLPAEYRLLLTKKVNDGDIQNEQDLQDEIRLILEKTKLENELKTRTSEETDRRILRMTEELIEEKKPSTQIKKTLRKVYENAKDSKTSIPRRLSRQANKKPKQETQNDNEQLPDES